MVAAVMPAPRGLVTRDKLIAVATDLIRRRGYTATTVDDICAKAELTKGAFFHHFKTKDDLVNACLAQWDQFGAAMDASAPFQSISDPRRRVIGYMDFYIAVFSNAQLLKSCLAGTTAQEISDSHQPLRAAANACFTHAVGRFQTLLDDAVRGSRRRVNTAELATLWMATIQGSIILAKAAQNDDLIRRSLAHVRDYIVTQLPAPLKKGRKRS